MMPSVRDEDDVGAGTEAGAETDATAPAWPAAPLAAAPPVLGHSTATLPGRLRGGSERPAAAER